MNVMKRSDEDRMSLPRLDSATRPVEGRESPRRFTREVLTPSNVRALQLGAALVTAFAFMFALEITLELVEVFGG